MFLIMVYYLEYMYIMVYYDVLSKVYQVSNGSRLNATLCQIKQRGTAKSGSSDGRCCKTAPNGWIDLKLSMEGSFGR